ncbi:murein biosynthesis integral membrane protein MurJ [Bartonella sp. DGB2]|uniref:murein biosynthesis integral membrane protein MurJ n=1 Tax=Bartonella sp. DGB2 TaxID=3388426 RepID=UPI00398FB0EF
MSLIRKFSTVASGTFISRLFGFAREMLMAAALGTGPVADAFNAAFRFPNTFRRLFAEGAFSAAFVPLFSKYIAQGGHEEARRFAQEVFGVLFSVLIMLTLLMEFSMPFLVSTIIAPGFYNDAEKYAATIRFSTIMFPYLACMSLAAMMAGMLNSLHHYFAAAIAPVFLNIILIAVLAYTWIYGLNPWHVGLGLSWGVMAAGFIQLLIVWAAVARLGMPIGFRRPRLSPSVKRLLWLALPAAITGGVTQINLLINTNIASAKAGAVSSLAYADRLYQLPLGVVGIAVATVLLPELTSALRNHEITQAHRIQNRAIEFTLFLTLPAAAAFLVMATPLVQLLFERGHFTSQSTQIVAHLLAIYGLGLPAFVLIKAFIPNFFAREDTKTPLVFAIISMIANVSIALSLFPYFSAAGIVIAEVSAGWLNALLLFMTLVKRGHFSHERAFFFRFIKLLVSTILMAVALHYSLRFLATPLSPQAPLLQRALTISSLIIGAMIVYFSASLFLGVSSIALLKRSLTRHK